MSVYFIRSGNYIKIGYAEQPRRRLKELQTGNPEKLQLLGTVPGGPDREREIHHLFNDFRVKGEWFELVTDILAYLTSQGALAKTQAVKKRKAANAKPAVTAGLRQNRNGRYKKDGPGWLEFIRKGRKYYPRERWWEKTGDEWKKKAKYRSDLPALSVEEYESWRRGEFVIEL